MGHSPSREAFSMSLHLSNFHDCESYIFNINGMSYKGENPFGLISGSEFNVNAELSAGQKVFIDYMGLAGDVNIISFPNTPMTTQKIAQICNAMNELNIEAVISHSENLMVMEVLYRCLPSLFATTGSVVPYAHNDAYFVPKDLVTEQTKFVANKYEHSTFYWKTCL